MVAVAELTDERRSVEGSRRRIEQQQALLEVAFFILKFFLQAAKLDARLGLVEVRGEVLLDELLVRGDDRVLVSAERHRFDRDRCLDLRWLRVLCALFFRRCRSGVAGRENDANQSCNNRLKNTA